MSALNEAIAAIKEGRRAEGREMLGKILLVEPNNVTALFWMTEVADTIDERRKYLNRILTIDPNNVIARKALEMLGPIQEPMASRSQMLAARESAPQQKTSVTESTTATIAEDTKKCPYCAETIRIEAVICRYCGRSLVTEQSQSKPAHSAKDRMFIGGLLAAVMLVIYPALQQFVQQRLAGERVLHGYATESVGMVIIRYGIIVVGILGLIVFVSGLLAELNRSSQ